jgi:hypothetical protein
MSPNELALPGHSEALLPHITDRLSAAEDSDGNFRVKTLDVRGQPSALSVDHLWTSCARISA